jgi:hypothetical protein
MDSVQLVLDYFCERTPRCVGAWCLWAAGRRGAWRDGGRFGADAWRGHRLGTQRYGRLRLWMPLPSRPSGALECARAPGLPGIGGSRPPGARPDPCLVPPPAPLARPSTTSAPRPPRPLRAPAPRPHRPRRPHAAPTPPPRRPHAAPAGLPAAAPARLTPGPLSRCGRRAWCGTTSTPTSSSGASRRATYCRCAPRAARRRARARRPPGPRVGGAGRGAGAPPGARPGGARLMCATDAHPTPNPDTVPPAPLDGAHQQRPCGDHPGRPQRGGEGAAPPGGAASFAPLPPRGGR